MGETRRNTWKYQEFKSMPHYESLYYAKRLLKPSCPSGSMDVISKLLLTDFMRFDVDEFNDNLTGHFILDRIILVKISCR